MKANASRHAGWGARVRLGLTAAVAGLVVGAAAARAGTVTNIDLTSYYTGNWSGEINGTEVAAGAKSGTGNAGTGLSFSDPTGQYVEVGEGTSQTSGSLSIALTNNSTVNGLFNDFFGATGDQADVTFTNSAGHTDKFSLTGGDTIRDYNNDGYVNTLSGGGGDLTARMWWSTQDANKNGNGEPSQRLDAQAFMLPSAWAGTDLVSVLISDPSNSGGDVILTALQVGQGSPTPPPSVPEPGSLAMLGTGVLILGFAGFARRLRFF